MRSVLSFLLGVVALAGVAVGTPALWAERNVVSADGYVALTEPLGGDPEFQQALATSLVDAVLQRADLPEAGASRVRPVLTQLATNLTTLPGYPEAWTETNARSHALVFDEGADDVAIDVAPLARLLVQQGGGRLGVDVPVPDTLPITVGNERERAVVDDLATLDPRALYVAVLTVVAAVLCLLLARRRSTATLWLGIGSLLVAGVLKAASVVALPVVAGSVDAPSDLGNRVVDLLERAAGDSFDAWLLVLAGVAVVLVVVGGIGRVVSGRRATADA